MYGRVAKLSSNVIRMKSPVPLSQYRRPGPGSTLIPTTRQPFVDEVARAESNRIYTPNQVSVDEEVPNGLAIVDPDVDASLDRVPYCPLITEKVVAADRPL